MPIEGYHKWASDYSVMFGLSSEADMKMLLSWEEVFADSAATAQELHTVARKIANNPPKWRTEHLAAIQTALRASRAEALATVKKTEQEGQDDCRLCGNSGYVSVPHPRQIVDGKWVIGASRYTAAVACGCYRGQRHVNKVRDYNREQEKKDNERPIPMNLAQYELLCPRWGDELAEFERQQREERRAHNTASDLDKEKGKLAARSIQKILERLK